MKRADFLFVAGATLVLLPALVPGSSGQTAANSLPAANAATSAEPREPSAATGFDDVETPPAVLPDTQLQMQVQDALSRVPELSNDSLRVAALPDGLELTGSVVTGRERQAALRIAQSFARGRKVVDHIVVSGRNAPGAEPSRASHQANAQP